MAKQVYTRERLAGQDPDMAELKGHWNRAVDNRTNNYWHRQRLNWEARYCQWANQSVDGRKWPKNKSQKVFPWPGAADSRVHLVDKYVREDVAMLMSVWQDMRIMVRPNAPARNAAWANRVTSLLRWLVYEEMEESADEAEYLANLVLERGAAVMGVWWCREESLTRDKIEMKPIMMAAEQAKERLDRGERGDALQFQAMLPDVILNPTMQNEAVSLVKSMVGPNAPSRLWTEDRIRKLLTSLRDTGTAVFPRTIISKDRPELRALAWNEDIWTPPECGNLQQSRQVFIREWLSGPALDERARSLEWNDRYVDKVLDTQRGRITELLTRPGKVNGSWNSLGVPETDELYEVVTAYERLTDGDGIPGIYVTAFCPGMSTEEGNFDSELLDYAHGKYPFVVFGTEKRSRLIDDARGYGETAATWQQQIKRQWDARIDRTDVATLPPSHHPPGEEPDAWGPGVRIPTITPDRYGYFESPKWDPGSKEIEETVRAFADEYFGRAHPDGRNRVEAALLKRELVHKWMAGWKQEHTMILQLAQQYLPDEIFFRAVGGEQGQGIHATREEIQGPFNVTLKFNPQDLDPELVQEKLKLIQEAINMDAMGIVDRNEAITAAMELIDPSYAERLLRPAEGAKLAEVKDEQDTLAKLLLGIQVDLNGNENVALRKQVLTELIANNEIARRLIKTQPEVEKNVQRRMDQLDFNIQQKLVNPEIGRRLGTAPSTQATAAPGATPTPTAPNA